MDLDGNNVVQNIDDRKEGKRNEPKDKQNDIKSKIIFVSTSKTLTFKTHQLTIRSKIEISSTSLIKNYF